MRRLRLLLLRHAEAAPVRPGERDQGRRLTARGRSDAEEIGSVMRTRELLPDLAISSDARRATETMRLVLGRLGRQPQELVVPELYAGDVKDILSSAQRAGGAAGTVLIVGHNPSIEGFAAGMARQGDPGAASRIGAGYPPSALAVFDIHATTWADFNPAQAEVRLFLVPGGR